MADDPTVPRPAKKPLLPRWLKFLLMLLGFLFLVSALLWVIADISTRDALEAEIAELRAKGWPTSHEELHVKAVPDEENAALIYEQAFPLITEVPAGRWDTTEDSMLRIQPRRLKPDELDALEAKLSRNAEALRLLRQAAQRPRCRFPGGLESWTRIRPDRGFRASVRLLALAMLMAAEKKRPEEAVGYWLDTAALLRGLQDNRNWYMDTFRRECTYWTLANMSGLEGMIWKGILGHGELETVLASLEGLEGRKSYAEMLRSGAFGAKFVAGWSGRVLLSYVGLPQGQLPLSWRLKNSACRAGAWLWGSWLGRPLRQYDAAQALRVSVELAQVAEQPYHQAQVSARRTRAWVEQLPRLAVMARKFCRDRGHDHRSQARAEAQVVVARAGVALALFRRKHGRYPDSLNELVPGVLPVVPVDPFDGHMLRYIRDDELVVVYSIGDDLRDDGGSEEPRPLGWPIGSSTYGVPEDIVFTVWRSPALTEEPDDE